MPRRTTSSTVRPTTGSMQAPVPRPRSSLYSGPPSRRQSSLAPSATIQLHWLFRSNIPRRRGMSLPNDPRKRNFFGVGEIIGVLANPSETLRSLTDSKRMLEETRRELAEARERAQLSPTHTFSPLPGFFERSAELKAVGRALEGDPSFTVLFGASSVGKTALLRQVLTRPNYHVLHFDLRIAGFADLASLYMSLSQQMEGFFMGVAQDPEMPGYEAFEKEAWAFKHDRLSVERRLSGAAQSTDGLTGSPGGDIKTSDVARLMELFQSSLLRYWKFQPSLDSTAGKSKGETQEKPASSRQSWRARMFSSRRKESEKMRKENGNAKAEKGKERALPQKKIPVVFFDEAHKLPALIRSIDAMKCLLDAMLVLTKQDRLCHVIHATSDPFYQTWLRQLNVMQHCKIITIGDFPKVETRRYFRERVLPNVPEHLRSTLDFERLYEAFGGKLVHWQDFIADYVNSNGKLDIKQSSHFIQAHALLNLHVIHSAQASSNGQAPESPDDGLRARREGSTAAVHRLSPAPTSGSGFKIYTPLAANPHQSTPTMFAGSNGGDEAPQFQADFTAHQLLRVMNRLAQPRTRSLPYFLLCREMGARAIDGMVKGRILDLRWTEPVSREGGVGDASRVSMRVRESMRAPFSGSSGTAVNDPAYPAAASSSSAALASGIVPPRAPGLDGEVFYESEEGEMLPMSDEEVLREQDRLMDEVGTEADEEVLGPKLVPISPIMRYAMREVVQEYYADDQSVSEYASLSDIEEY